MNRPVVIDFPGERLPTWNSYHGRGNWHQRQREVHRWGLLVLAALSSSPPPVFSVPVELTAIQFRKRRNHRPDCTNLCVKPLEDALIGRVIMNDDPDHVAGAHAYSLSGPDLVRVYLRAGDSWTIPREDLFSPDPLDTARLGWVRAFRLDPTSR